MSWASRWDFLLAQSSQPRIRWLSILNSLVVVMVLTGLVALVLIRTLRRDVSRYNRLEASLSVSLLLPYLFGTALIWERLHRHPW